jgi:tripartite-type tricarboxylate transporter receptor subunit TctC
MLGRERFSVGLLAIVCVTAALPAASLSYPTRSITLVVPFPAGAATDAVARIVSEHMAKTLGQAIVIENDAGAGGTTATRRVARAAPDGYTIAAGSMATHAAAVAQYPNIKYDPAKDFTPIGLTVEAPAVIVTRKDFPVNTLKEFIDYVTKNQAKLNEAHGGVGSQCIRTAHFCIQSWAPRRHASPTAALLQRSMIWWPATWISVVARSAVSPR